MNHRFGTRLSRLAVILFAAGGLTALGCSLIVEFDEAKIPGEDTGIVVDSGTDAPVDSFVPPTDSGNDTNVPDTTVPADTADTSPADTADTTPADTATEDTTPADTATDDTADAAMDDAADAD